MQPHASVCSAAVTLLSLWIVSCKEPTPVVRSGECTPAYRELSEKAVTGGDRLHSNYAKFILIGCSENLSQLIEQELTSLQKQAQAVVTESSILLQAIAGNEKTRRERIVDKFNKDLGRPALADVYVSAGFGESFELIN